MRGPLLVALTPGEPAGIGPDLAVMLAARAQRVALVVIADPALIAARAARLGCTLRVVELASAAAAGIAEPGVVQVLPVATAATPRAGASDCANAAYVLECLDLAVDLCRGGELDAMVTGPVNKAVINDAGVPFSGHTEYLAERLGVPLPVMLLVAGTLRVALLTTHVPLRRVADMMTVERIETVTGIVHRELVSRFGIARPRIGVLGLNPHAGEQGHLGDEERSVFAPAVAALSAGGLAVDGPLPADTAFTAAGRAAHDAFVAAYHDQGLAPLKALSFGDAVNVTLGLPIVRTSVDHGTAFDLAGTGRADPASLAAAIALAADLAGRARRAAGA